MKQGFVSIGSVWLEEGRWRSRRRRRRLSLTLVSEGVMKYEKWHVMCRLLTYFENDSRGPKEDTERVCQSKEQKFNNAAGLLDSLNSVRPGG